MKGQVVYHPRHGRGVAGVPRKSGLEYEVRFDNGLTSWVRTDELELDRVSSGPTVARQADREIPINFMERRVIEALRLGIVPDEGVQLFTVGREAEVSALKSWLDAPNEPGRIIVGAYGTGKTHLLRYFRMLALEAGYAVSLIEMDSQETPFSRPKRVYSEIARNLSWRDGDRLLGFRELVERGLVNGLLQDHIYFKNLRRTSEARVWDWVEGRDPVIRPWTSDRSQLSYPPLYDYTTAANIYCYLLSGIGWLARSPALHLRGLLVLFDESEALYAARGAIAVDRSVNFLDALILTAKSDRGMLRPAYQTDFGHAGHAKEIPFLYRNPSGLKLLFAFTSEKDLWVSRELYAMKRLKLGSLETDHWTTVVAGLWMLYHSAYDGCDEKIDLKAFVGLLVRYGAANTRAAVKGAVEALDICRFGTYVPEDNI